MIQQITPKPLRMHLVEYVLEGAKDVGDEMVIAACRRLLWADTLGWKKHHIPADYSLVKAFADVAS